MPRREDFQNVIECNSIMTTFRHTPEWGRWLIKFAKRTRTRKSDLIDQALNLLAKERGIPEAPERIVRDR